MTDEKELALLRQLAAMEILCRRIIADRACICNAPAHRCGTNQMLEDMEGILLSPILKREVLQQNFTAKLEPGAKFGPIKSCGGCGHPTDSHRIAGGWCRVHGCPCEG